MQSPVLDWLPTPGATVLEAALAYARHGLRVTPVHGIVDGRCTCKRDDCKPGKHPVPKAWQRRATCNVDELQDLFRASPTGCNVGLVMGEQGDGTYLVAFDIDGERGRQKLADLEARLGPMPETLAARSGRADGGEHRIFALGPGQDSKRIGNRVQLGLDVRAKGGQIVVCPSLHTSGSRYTWSNDCSFATLPDEWFEAIASPLPEPRKPVRTARIIPFGSRYLDKVIDEAVKDIAAAGDGERNHRLWTKTCTVLEYCAGHNVATAVPLDRLADAGRACGLPPREVDETIRKASAHVAKTGATRHAPPPSARTPRASTAPPASSTAPDAEVIDIDSVDESWRDELAVSSTSGMVKPTFRNVCLILRHDPMFVGRLTYNRMRVTPCVDGRPMRDADVARFREDIEREWRFSPSTESVVQGILLVSDEQSFHPVQDYLNGLVWDGERRIERVAREVLGHAAPTLLTQRMLRSWFVAAVARALRPGCKVDTTIVLRGDQGFKKSTFFATLGGEWFTDTYVDVRNKDGLLQVHAAWIYEWGEIERVTTRTSSSDVKAFLSSARDDVRPPYGRGIVNQPRSSVIVGTTNKAFLDDETGSRRFWPIWVHCVVNVDVLKAWRDQIWAEAVAALRADEAWWLSEDEERTRSADADDHMVENPWLEKIAMWLREPARRRMGVTTAEVIVGALNIEIGRVKGEETRVGKALRRLKWWPRQETRGEARVRVYYPPTHQDAAQPAQVRSDEVVHTSDSEKQHSAQPAQPAQVSPAHSRSSDAARKGGVFASASAHANTRGEVKSGCAGDAGCDLREIIEADCTTSERGCAEVVQSGADQDAVGTDSGLSEWLETQGIGPDESDD